MLNLERNNLEKQALEAAERVEMAPPIQADPVDLLSYEENVSEGNQDVGGKPERPRARTGGYFCLVIVGFTCNFVEILRSESRGACDQAFGCLESLGIRQRILGRLEHGQR